MKNGVLILGATSSIAREVALQLAEKGYPLFLASRDEENLKRFAADIAIRHHVDVKYGTFDAEDIHSHAQFLERVIQKMNGLEGVVVAFGESPNQKNSNQDFEVALKTININFVGAASILTYVANYLENQRSGFILGITSVAGDRGRQANYVYGAAKSGITTFLQGLRARLYPSGVRVLTVKPGYVDTAMTYGKPGIFLVATPEYVGKKIVNALIHSREQIYVPWFWRPIMWIIKNIPETIFKRLKI